MYLTINGFPYSAFPEYSCVAFSTPCNFVPLFPFLAVSTPAFWDILVPLFPFPLFHVSHFQRPRPGDFVFDRDRRKKGTSTPVKLWHMSIVAKGLDG